MVVVTRRSSAQVMIHVHRLVAEAAMGDSALACVVGSYDEAQVTVEQSQQEAR